MDLLIMRSLLNVFHDGISKIETDLSKEDLESTEKELKDRGYSCKVEEKDGKKVLVVERKL